METVRPGFTETMLALSAGWSGVAQLILMAGVLIYGVWHIINRKPFNLLQFVFYIVCGYLAVVLALFALGTLYRGQAAIDVGFALANFMNWAMTIVLFGFLPMVLLAAIFIKPNQPHQSAERDDD